MQLSPGVRKFLEKLGVNTTRLQWKLYQWERQRESRAAGGKPPTKLNWWNYPHKFCHNCRAIVDRDARTCPSCGKRVPSYAVYRTLRLLGIVTPEGGAATVNIFLVAMAVVFLLMIVMQGVSALMRPSMPTLLVFGAWHPLIIERYGEYWRWMSFGLVHGGIIHFGFNAFALSQVGPLVESHTGRKRMLTIITVTQFTSALATHLWYVEYLGRLIPTVGASGWLFGLIGFGIGYYHGAGTSGRMERNALLQWALYAFVFGIIIGANNAAHFGGFLGGLLLGLTPEPHPRQKLPINKLWEGAFWLSLAVWLITLFYMAQCIVLNWTPGGRIT